MGNSKLNLSKASLDRLIKCCDDLYEISTKLWYSTDVVGHAEGHPGRSGHLHNDIVENTLNHIENDIKGLIEINKRLNEKPSEKEKISELLLKWDEEDSFVLTKNIEEAFESENQGRTPNLDTSAYIRAKRAHELRKILLN